MKKFIKILLCIVLVIAIVTAIVVGPYAISFLPFKTDENLDVPIGNIVVNVTDSIKDIDKNGNVSLNGVLQATPTEAKSEIFNYYGISYTSDSYLKGTLTYEKGLKEVSEDFFLEPSKKEATFYSFIDGCLDGEKGQKVIALTFECLNKESCKVNIRGFSVFNREIPEQEIFIENETHKLGIDLLWGGALSYLEDLDSNVQAVFVDGKIKVDSNASERYNAESVNNNVNLINRNDTGRLVQQSYYGTLDYDFGVYMDNDWRYNPVQGGNQFNDASKIVDLRVTDTEIYIKCRPLDWAKEKEYITPSYMEATYSLENGAVHAKCRFIDFSGYPEAETSQEIPAFYCIEPLNNFVYYKGNKPWTDGKLTNEPDLIFWPDAGYPKFYSKENWAAFTGEFNDSFGIGVYVDNEEEFLAGVYERETTSNEDPSKDSPTSYIAITKTRTFKSFDPYEYEYYLATGNTSEIRNTFKSIDTK